ncbi:MULTISPECIES: ERAP1-like C-terminal domain-containing protein [Microbacterium]|uniref:ERAP1-like C-terminal domain-containing protein n=1 Tax=Microbacterium TaxID=33882 RepID=UPI00217D1493|nr:MULTISPECIES: ERAP1-like C-terminal domain-containing protein [Microbacterium]UWF78429.1 ERAP1-like C-terminal domain-containing protein [Microbacterium neungamense]WCM56605.1 ERAP1-like C-terminal domain-containing protein [Microbacterium sp. EF45047]
MWTSHPCSLVGTAFITCPTVRGGWILTAPTIAKEWFVRALASRPDPAVRAEAWRAAWEDRSLSNDHLDATIAGFRAGGRRDLVAGFDEEYFRRIRSAWAERSIEIAQRLVVGLFPAGDTLDPVDAWLAENEDAPAALRRLVLEQRDHLARDLRVRASQPA